MKRTGRKRKRRTPPFPDYTIVLRKWPNFRIPRTKPLPPAQASARADSPRLQTEHGILWSMPGNPFGYFGWPTVARMDDGSLVVAASGMRLGHVCPYGRTVFLKSRDEGRTWSSPRVINDTPLDDRDAGILSLGGKRLLLSWFSSDTRVHVLKPKTNDARSFARPLSRKERSWIAARARAWADIEPLWKAGLQWTTDEIVSRFHGSWVRISEDGGDTWNPPVRVDVSAPHGPIRLRDGRIFYFGKSAETHALFAGAGAIRALASRDGGTWTSTGCVPFSSGTHPHNYHEPHAVELPSGRIIGLIRLQSIVGHDISPLGLPPWGIAQTESDDGGKTWTTARSLGFHGSPPHLMRHSTGVLICSYGYRARPLGQRVALSHDEGRSWKHDYVLRADGLSADLGYPSTVELTDGDLLTVYYQQRAKGEHPSLLCTRWELP